METSDGQERNEYGRIYNRDGNETLSVNGYYSYTGPDGVKYEVEYEADENGFRPIGKHLPPAADVLQETEPVQLPVSAIASLAGGGLG